jgi:hydrogenase maturation protease
MATLIIGVGNDDRGDDAVGLSVVRRLRGARAGNPSAAAALVAVIEASGEGAALIEAWRSANIVILIDAVHSGAMPGTIYRFEAHDRPIPTHSCRSSTHAFGVSEAIELARALGQLPACLIVYGIEGRSFEVGDGLSSEAESAAWEVLERLQCEIDSGNGSAPLPSMPSV